MSVFAPKVQRATIAWLDRASNADGLGAGAGQDMPAQMLRGREFCYLAGGNGGADQMVAGL
jgi:hypothetical protein